jgi:hypothetical protein
MGHEHRRQDAHEASQYNQGWSMLVYSLLLVPCQGFSGIGGIGETGVIDHLGCDAVLLGEV